MYRVEFTSAVARKIYKLDRPVCAHLSDAIELFAHSPRPDRVKKLTNTKDMWCIRVGDYWIIYSVEDNVLVVIVVRVVCRHEICHS